MILRIIKFLFRYTLIIFIFIFTFSLFSNLLILFKTRNDIFNNSTDIPSNEVALVLGTSKKIMGGQPNPYFHYRIEAAAELYNNKKVKRFILSGDNRTRYYNEPNDMKIALMQLGIPDSVITLDIAGLRTFDSVIRSKVVYGLDSVTIVTQAFHSPRAVYIGQHFDLEASAYVAKDLPFKRSLKLLVREYFARTKAVLDVMADELNIEIK